MKFSRIGPLLLAPLLLAPAPWPGTALSAQVVDRTQITDPASSGPALQIPTTITASGMGLPDDAPSWAVEGVPPSVWVLVEAASATTDRDEARRLYLDAEAEARSAVAARPDEVGTRFALAVVLGLRADVEGGRTKVRAAAALHDELTAILKLEPEHARARHMLGRLHAGVMRMNGVVRWVATRLLGGDALEGASWAEAERHLTFAEERDPEMLGHHLQLANLYRDTDRPDRALLELEHVFERTPTSAMEQSVWDEGVALLREMEGRKGSGGREGQ